MDGRTGPNQSTGLILYQGSERNRMVDHKTAGPLLVRSDRWYGFSISISTNRYQYGFLVQSGHPKFILSRLIKLLYVVYLKQPINKSIQLYWYDLWQSALYPNIPLLVRFFIWRDSYHMNYCTMGYELWTSQVCGGDHITCCMCMRNFDPLARRRIQSKIKTGSNFILNTLSKNSPKICNAS